MLVNLSTLNFVLWNLVLPDLDSGRVKLAEASDLIRLQDPDVQLRNCLHLYLHCRPTVNLRDLRAPIWQSDLRLI